MGRLSRPRMTLIDIGTGGRVVHIIGGKAEEMNGEEPPGDTQDEAWTGSPS